jgi:hypothetical protein
MVDREQTRQISCVVRQLKTLMENKVKGSITVHLDGSGKIGNEFDIRTKSIRDYLNGNKKGTPIDEDEFFNLLRGDN